MRLMILCVSDEEINTRHCQDIMDRACNDCQGAFILEAARSNGDIVSARKGATSYTLTAQGRSAHAGVEPDLMTVAKGLTAGYAPMGAVLMSDAIYQGIADGDAAAIVGHGHTYSAHPVSAAIGLEVLRLYHEGGLLANGVRHAERFARGLDALLAHPLVGDSRHRGLLGALELVSDKDSKQGFDASLKLSDRITAAAYRNRLVFRAFGDNILGFAPALSYTEAEFDLMFERLEKTLDDVLAEPEVRAALNVKAKVEANVKEAKDEVKGGVKPHVAA